MENLSYCMFGRLSLQMSKQLGQCKMETSNNIKQCKWHIFWWTIEYVSVELFVELHGKVQKVMRNVMESHGI